MTYNLTPQQALGWTPVVDSLMAYYRRENDDWVDNCPLCRHAIKNQPVVERYDKSPCPHCVWAALSRGPCFFGGVFPSRFKREVYEYRETRPKTWCAYSLRRLARWRKKLVEIAESGATTTQL